MLHKKLFVFVLAFLLTACGTIPKSIQVAKPSLPELGKGATVAFVAPSRGKKAALRPYCSGVWIDNTTILTALHCAQHAATNEELMQFPAEIRPLMALLMQEVKDPTGRTMQYVVESDVVNLTSPPKTSYKAQVLAIDPPHDLAIIKADSHNLPNKHLWLRVANEMPKVGDKVYVIGHPDRLYFTFMDGMVSAIRETDQFEMSDGDKFDGPFIQVYSGIFGGNSGGPVMSERGEIVGIVSFTPEMPHQGFAIAQITIKRFVFKTYARNLL